MAHDSFHSKSLSMNTHVRQWQMSHHDTWHDGRQVSVSLIDRVSCGLTSTRHGIKGFTSHSTHMRSFCQCLEKSFKPRLNVLERGHQLFNADDGCSVSLQLDQVVSNHVKWLDCEHAPTDPHPTTSHVFMMHPTLDLHMSLWCIQYLTTSHVFTTHSTLHFCDGLSSAAEILTVFLLVISVLTEWMNSALTTTKSGMCYTKHNKQTSRKQPNYYRDHLLITR